MSTFKRRRVQDHGSSPLQHVMTEAMPRWSGNPYLTITFTFHKLLSLFMPAPSWRRGPKPLPARDKTRFEPKLAGQTRFAGVIESEDQMSLVPRITLFSPPYWCGNLYTRPSSGTLSNEHLSSERYNTEVLERSGERPNHFGGNEKRAGECYCEYWRRIHTATPHRPQKGS